MLFLLKKIFPQLFISIILEDKKNIVKASIYRGNKLISSNEKTFDKSEKFIRVHKKFKQAFLILPHCFIFRRQRTRINT